MILRGKRKKVFIGLSGGVDSAVSAALLKEEGYEVIGVFIQTWHPDFLPCTEPEDRRSAMRVAAHLDMPFTTLDLSLQYRTEVAERMLEEYQKGNTPNPDVLCNKEVKFGAFYSFALSEGADLIAMGHYARSSHREGEVHLLSGVDSLKDQSYFLWMVEEKTLSRTLFPLGTLTKKQVREKAERFSLPNATRPDSQGICFLGDISMTTLLRHYLPLERGDVLNEEGKKIGFHEGACLYTIGQRHGFTVERAGPHDLPRYVIAKDLLSNTLTVSFSSVPASGKTILHLKSTNWIGRVSSGAYEARFRYRQALRSAILTLTEDSAVIELKEPAYVPAGQSLVLYEGARMVGGGIVDKVR